MSDIAHGRKSGHGADRWNSRWTAATGRVIIAEVDEYGCALLPQLLADEAEQIWLLPIARGHAHSRAAPPPCTRTPTVTCSPRVAGPSGPRVAGRELYLAGRRRQALRVGQGLGGGHRETKVYGRLDCPSALGAIARGGYARQRVL
jgi:hypothetical protein